MSEQNMIPRDNNAADDAKSCVGPLELTAQARSLWGKTDRADGELWLPLYVHMSDSALTARFLWDKWLPAATRAIIERDVQEDSVLAAKIAIFLAGVHDIGKATPVFQGQPIRRGVGNTDSMSWLPEKAGLDVPRFFHNKPTHPIAGETILVKYLRSKREGCGWNKRIATSYASIIGSHHGTPPTDGDLLRAARAQKREMGWDKTYQVSWESVQTELIDYVRQLAGMSSSDLQRLSTLPLSPQSEEVLTGVTIVADWIASNSEDGYFPLIPVTPMNADNVLDSWGSLRRRAAAGWSRVNLPSAWHPLVEHIQGDADVDKLFSDRFELPEGSRPRPAQSALVKLASEVEHPGLMVLEAPMGEGKTEAALAAAEILGQRLGCGGVCIALPTMATTDAMFGRVHAWLDALPNSGSSNQKDIWLAHGKAALNDEFQSMVRASRSSHIASIYDDDLEGRISAETTVSEWLSGRKKGVLSNFLVCTVDQVLMSALRMKHVALRQLAMVGKVVIIDPAFIQMK